MSKIKRHKLDLPMIQDRFQRAFAIVPEDNHYSRENANNLTFLITNSLDAARCGSVVDSNSVEVDRGLRRAAQGSAAFLALAASPPKNDSGPSRGRNDSMEG